MQSEQDRLRALEQAIWARDQPRGVIHHSDRGGPYLSITFSNQLSEQGFKPSVGSTGDSYKTAIAGSVIGIYKTEVIHRLRSWKTLNEVEYWDQLKLLGHAAWIKLTRLRKTQGNPMRRLSDH